MTDVRVRKSLAYGLDRRAVAEVLPANEEVATGEMVPPVLAGHTPDVALRFDPEEARRLLDRVGSVGTLEFAAPRGDRKRIVRELIHSLIETWRESLGVETAVTLFEPEDADDIWEGDDPAPTVPAPSGIPATPTPSTTCASYSTVMPSATTPGSPTRNTTPLWNEPAVSLANASSSLAYTPPDRLALSQAVAAVPLAYARNVVAMRPGVEGWWEFGKSWSNFVDLTVSR